MNETYIDIFIDPFNGEYDQYETPRNLNFKWEVREFKNNILALSLNFSKPLDVSMNFIYDKVIVQLVNETQIFKSLKNKELSNFKVDK